MNETQFAHLIRQRLNEGLRLDASVAARLRAAREQALARHRPGGSGDLALAGTGRTWNAAVLAWRVVLPAVILVLAFAATYAWQQSQRAAEVEEIDAMLLSGDLPIDAYLDQGFAAWLKRRASQ